MCISYKVLTSIKCTLIKRKSLPGENLLSKLSEFNHFKCFTWNIKVCTMKYFLCYIILTRFWHVVCGDWQMDWCCFAHPSGHWPVSCLQDGNSPLGSTKLPVRDSLLLLVTLGDIYVTMHHCHNVKTIALFCESLQHDWCNSEQLRATQDFSNYQNHTLSLSKIGDLSR